MKQRHVYIDLTQNRLIVNFQFTYGDKNTKTEHPRSALTSSRSVARIINETFEQIDETEQQPGNYIIYNTANQAITLFEASEHLWRLIKNWG